MNNAHNDEFAECPRARVARQSTASPGIVVGPGLGANGYPGEMGHPALRTGSIHGARSDQQGACRTALRFRGTPQSVLSYSPSRSSLPGAGLNGEYGT